MAKNKIERIDQEIAKTREKIAEQQEKLKDLEAQKTEAESLEIVKMVRAQRITPAQLSTKPSSPPWAATFSATMSMSGSGRKKDATIARITGAMGPRSPKPSSRASQNSSVPSWWSQPIIVISIPRVPSLSFFFSISGFYDTPVNKIRAFFVLSPILRDCGGVSCKGLRS